MEGPVFSLVRGDASVLVTIPHAGTRLAPGMAARMTEAGRALPDTDWYVPRLYQVAARLGAGVLRAHYSRYVIDLNRGGDDAALYPGRPKTGLVPTLTFDGRPIYRTGAEPGESEIAARRQRYWQPYHDAVAAELDRVRARHGHAVLWDAHSIGTVIPRLFEGRLPDLNFGTNDGAACAGGLIAAVMAGLTEGGGYSSVLDGRFKGGYTTRHYGRPAERIHAIQLEKAQATYLASEGGAAPAADARKMEKLSGLIGDLLERACAWRP
ncbi:N-formylglutamate deformylase [Nguyenibacter sp. L1]|uniref:N-formylglutamate deformylase n=1 Tax=Nguyenibacter sp. L1 TaxID=3049350 RepID=UPI002B4861F6|nr:N-formylglutamate deformylase [Nguyenibacter sp. L1]WRH86744.1 N-formylglutamate deformylase [Nguyenibacter sp. L1]